MQGGYRRTSDAISSVEHRNVLPNTCDAIARSGFGTPCPLKIRNTLRIRNTLPEHLHGNRPLRIRQTGTLCRGERSPCVGRQPQVSSRSFMTAMPTMLSSAGTSSRTPARRSSVDDSSDRHSRQRCKWTHQLHTPTSQNKNVFLNYWRQMSIGDSSDMQ